MWEPEKWMAYRKEPQRAPHLAESSGATMVSRLVGSTKDPLRGFEKAIVKGKWTGKWTEGLRDTETAAH